jgi:hypothetical protein
MTQAKGSETRICKFKLLLNFLPTLLERAVKFRKNTIVILVLTEYTRKSQCIFSLNQNNNGLVTEFFLHFFNSARNTIFAQILPRSPETWGC